MSVIVHSAFGNRPLQVNMTIADSYGLRKAVASYYSVEPELVRLVRS